MHAKDRLPAADKPVQAFQHKAVAAERHDRIGPFRLDRAVKLAQFGKRPVRRLGIGGDERYAQSGPSRGAAVTRR
jgi:hypothetical protein